MSSPAVKTLACGLALVTKQRPVMLLHAQKTLRLAQPCADFANKARPWNMRAFHSSQWCRIQYLNVSEKTFNEVALNEHENDRVVLVDFYADWCGPCKMISPILEKLTNDPNVKSGSGRSLDLVTVNTDREFVLAHKYQIRSLPTVLAFKDGHPVGHFTGALGEGDIRKFLQQL